MKSWPRPLSIGVLAPLGYFRKPLNGCCNLRDQFLAARCRCSGEFGEVDHRHQFANPGKSSQQIVVHLSADRAQPRDVFAAGFFRLAYPFIAACD